MKEYKTVKTNLGLTGRLKKLENILNKYASEGWEFRHMDDHGSYVLLERTKNR